MAKINFEPILNDLASGKITADEARGRIEELKKIAAMAAKVEKEIGADATAADAEDVAHGGEQTQRIRPGGLERIKVQATGRRVRIQGDSTITTLSVEGQHVLRRTGTVMEITANGEIGPRFEGFSIIRPPRSIGDFSDIALGKELIIKVNPKLLVDVELTTGGLRIEKVPRLGRIRVTAAGSTIEGVAEVQDLLAQAGSVSVEGPICKGRSRLRVESGSMAVTLTKGANVAISGDAKVGRISWPGEASEVDEYVIGNGSARLQVSVLMGMATIKVEE